MQRENDTTRTFLLIVIGALVLSALLALKALKQFISLCITLLSLKAVWLLLIALFIISYAKKAGASPRDSGR